MRFLPSFCVSLERAIGPYLGTDTQLWNSKIFHAAIYPDLPPSQTLWGLIKRKISGKELNAQVCCWGPGDVREGRSLVRSVGAHLDTESRLRRKLVKYAGGDESGNKKADALMILSGSHPVRRRLRSVRAAFGWLDAVELLRLAVRMKEEEALSRDVGLWATVNPMAGDIGKEVDLFVRKVEAGATVVVTQPPLIWERFEDWMVEVRRQGIDCDIVVGLPIFSSVNNVRFWYRLVGIDVERAERQFKTAIKAQALSVESFISYQKNMMQLTLKRLREYREICGVHVMATSPAARRMALAMVTEDPCIFRNDNDGAYG